MLAEIRGCCTIGSCDKRRDTRKKHVRGAAKLRAPWFAAFWQFRFLHLFGIVGVSPQRTKGLFHFLPTMNQIEIPSHGDDKRMSSREIAELTGKEHKHVMRDLRLLKTQIGALFGGYAQIWTHPQNGQEYEQFVLDKETTLTLLLGYDAVARMKVVKRWQELESQAAKPQHLVPQTFTEALRLALEQAEQIEKQRQELALAAPKVDFHDRYAASTGDKGFREVCKLLRANESRFREFLKAKGIIYYLSGSMTPIQQHQDAGRFVVKAGSSNHGHAFNQR